MLSCYFSSNKWYFGTSPCVLTVLDRVQFSPHQANIFLIFRLILTQGLRKSFVPYSRQNNSLHPHPTPKYVCLLSCKRTFTDVIKLRIWHRREYPGLFRTNVITQVIKVEIDSGTVKKEMREWKQRSAWMGQWAKEWGQLCISWWKGKVTELFLRIFRWIADLPTKFSLVTPKLKENYFTELL